MKNIKNWEIFNESREDDDFLNLHSDDFSTIYQLNSNKMMYLGTEKKDNPNSQEWYLLRPSGKHSYVVLESGPVEQILVKIGIITDITTILYESRDDDWSDEADEWREDALRDEKYMRRTIENNPDDVECPRCGCIMDYDNFDKLTEEDMEEAELDPNFNYVSCPDCGEIFDI